MRRTLQQPCGMRNGKEACDMNGDLLNWHDALDEMLGVLPCA